MYPLPSRVLRLADEVWWVAHSDQSGRGRLHPRALGVGVAAGLLGELMLSGHADITGGVVVAANLPYRPDDALAHTTLGRLLAEPGVRDVHTWLRFLGEDACDAVAGRLVLDGRLVKHRPTWRRRAALYEPVDANDAIRTVSRLYSSLRRGEQLSAVDQVLVGLVDAAGLTRAVLFDSPPGVEERLRAWVAALPAGLRELVGWTESVISRVVLTHRA